MINLVVIVWVENFIRLDCVIQYTCFRNFLGLEALVFLEILAVVVAQVVVRDNRGDPDSRADQVVAHDSLKSSLARLEVTAPEKPSLLLSILDDCRVESILRGSVQVKNLLLDASYTEQY